MDLFQAEWCPHSHKVRQRLTELGVDFTAKQVAAEPDEREELRALAGDTSIPTLVDENGNVVSGEDDILEYLGARYHDRPDADAHRGKARDEVPQFAELEA